MIHGQFLGLGKTKFNSSVCLINKEIVELVLAERLNRKKNSGSWPELPLSKIYHKLEFPILKIGENRDVHTPQYVEDLHEQIFPFYDFLKKKKLEYFTKKFNHNIEFVGHHLSHAYSALAISPFEKSIIVVMDGAGTQLPGDLSFEECTIYLQNQSQLNCVFSREVSFFRSKKKKNTYWGNRPGAFYEKVSEYVFNCPHSSGKLMGLAPYGKSILKKPALYKTNLEELLEAIDWAQSFKGKNKEDWENQIHDNWKNLASTAQEILEENYFEILNMIKCKFPEYENLILVGGCALNCTNNAKILYSKMFNKVFVPPFPGDEGIGFGIAHFLKFKEDHKLWNTVEIEKQTSSLGLISSIPNSKAIHEAFSTDEFEIFKSQNICQEVAEYLNGGAIVAWVQGRSEVGPRSLGHRSILARPDVHGLKNKLNRELKHRESFRPYGCSVIKEYSSVYFQVDDSAQSPFMSFALRVKNQYKKLLEEVSHIDGSSRAQTVVKEQNPLFYDLIYEFGKKSQLFCLLNTSLNVMGEPIVETVEDAKRFMQSHSHAIDLMAIDSFIIKKKIK